MCKRTIQCRDAADRLAACPERRSTRRGARKLAGLILCLPIFPATHCFGQDMPAQNDPVATMPAQVEASKPLLREPSMPGEQYLPPDHAVWKKYWLLRSARSRKSSSDVPLRP